MTGVRSNRPPLSADIHRVVSKVLAACPGRPVPGLCSMLGGSRCVRFSGASDRCLIRSTGQAALCRQSAVGTSTSIHR